MPTVAELTAVYGNFMLGPRRGKDVCDLCFNLTDGYERCYACSHGQPWLTGFCPISYSVAGGQLHHALKGYKRLEGGIANQLTVELAAVLWRHLTAHERCLADACGVDGFEIVTTVPSGSRDRQHHPLERIVGGLVEPTRDRFKPLLTRSTIVTPSREFDADRFEATAELSGASVLLIDDTWTTGASAQSAAAALKRAGATRVGAIVIGRYLNRDWRQNERRLGGISTPFDWSLCALCADSDTVD